MPQGRSTLVPSGRLASFLGLLQRVAGDIELWSTTLRCTRRIDRRHGRISSSAQAGPSYISTLATAAWLIAALCVGGEGEEDLTRWVEPRIGTLTSYALSRGNTYPAAARPSGMTAWSPQTGDYTSSQFYRYGADSFTGLRATHQASVWLGDYGQFSLMPVTGEPGFLPAQRGSSFRHETESSHPHLYAVELDDYGLRVEVAPTMRSAVLRVTSSQRDTVTLIVDPHPSPTFVELEPGSRRARGLTLTRMGGASDNFGCHFVIVFDRDPVAFGTFTDSSVSPGTVRSQGDHSGAYLTFAGVRARPLIVKVGTSFLSEHYAAHALTREIGDASFETIVAEGRSEWNELLSRISLSGATQDQRIVFYTALYRSLLFPRALHEIDPLGRIVHASPYDGHVRPGPLYADFGLWDTYRTLFPLYALLYPQRYYLILQGLLNAAVEGGAFPKWPSPGYRDGMPGTQAESLFADAWAKGLHDFDLTSAYAALRENGTVPGDRRVRRLGLTAYDSLGYVPADRYPGASSRTLEFAYGDFCLASLAAAVGHKQDAARFSERARNWRNVFDPVTGFVRGRLADGSWETSFDPFAWGGPFVEGNAWHYTWSVQHDVEGLVQALGGRDDFAARLDSFLLAPSVYRRGGYDKVIHEMREMAAAGTGQYAHGNQPSHHVLYLYNHAGRPWRTQALVRHVVDVLYRAAPDGLPGDEDTGSLSSWYVFSALGLYPLCPGKPTYELGAPRFERATLRLPGGSTLVIDGGGAGAPENVYVQSVHLDGEPLRTPQVEHGDIADGGTLSFEMGPRPNRSWYVKP